jgi:GNAT superfamily N-acetyltransferase
VPQRRSAEGVRVRPAAVDDAARLLPTFAEHTAYYPKSPIWLPKPLLSSTSEVADELADPKSIVWVAEECLDGSVLGIMKQTVESDNAATIVRDEGTLACTGAYVLPAARGRGVGAMLLAAMVDWGRDNGYTRLALDFEAANIFGAEFWLRHLTPVVYSVFRHVNDHMLDGEPQH